MSTITINHLTFAYPGQDDIFTDQSLTLDTSWHLGLTGRNGRGKSTLLNLLRGQLTGTGSINVPVPVTYFPQPVRDTSRDAWMVIDDITTSETWMVERELTLLGVPSDTLYRPFDSLSGGEQTKLLLAVLFADNTSFPLIDEPTNHLDHASREQVATYLNGKRQGYIVVAHDRDFLNAVTDHTLAIEKQGITLMQGNFATYTQTKDAQDQREQAEQSQLRKDIGRLQATARAKRDWSGNREADKHGNRHVKGSTQGDGTIADKGFITARAARTMKKAKHLEHRMDDEIAAKEKLLQNVEYIEPLHTLYTPDHHDVLITVRNLSLRYGDQPLFAPVSFTVKRGERVAVVGPNGAGKTSLIRALQGNFAGHVDGEITVVQSAQASHVRQLFPDNRGLLGDFAEQRGVDYQELLRNLKQLGVERSVFTVPIEQMSAGQQKKVELAASLATPTGLYVWDEPLNYLDVFNQDQLIDVINSVQPTMLLTEHDQHFIDAVATKVITLQPS